MINEFKGTYFFLSNFYEAPVKYDGLVYKNNEAAFQAQKTLDLDLREKFTTMNPSEAKKMGRKVNLRPAWEEIKDEVMYEICLDKFIRNNDLREKLVRTGTHELIEGTTGWHDNYWGNCECPKCVDIPGKNMLGKILMRVRDEIFPF